MTLSLVSPYSRLSVWSPSSYPACSGSAAGPSGTNVDRGAYLGISFACESFRRRRHAASGRRSSDLCVKPHALASRRWWPATRWAEGTHRNGTPFLATRTASGSHGGSARATEKPIADVALLRELMRRASRLVLKATARTAGRCVRWGTRWPIASCTGANNCRPCRVAQMQVMRSASPAVACTGIFVIVCSSSSVMPVRRQSKGVHIAPVSTACAVQSAA